MTEPRAKRARAHPAIGARIVSFGLSFSVALGILAKLVADRPQATSSSAPAPSVRPIVAAAPPNIIVRIVHRHARATTTSSSRRASWPIVQPVLRAAPVSPAPQPVAATHGS